MCIRDRNDIHVNMIQKWPVKRAMTNYKEKPRPFKLLETGVRVIDTVNPIVEDVYKRQAQSWMELFRLIYRAASHSFSMFFPEGFQIGRAHV